VQHRLLFAQVLEAVRALEAGVLTDIREGDVGAILGWGFAPWSGGPFGWLDILGAARAVRSAEALTARTATASPPATAARHGRYSKIATRLASASW
jgi:3-hydroxyacyl-CoA dehydrogenase / enoyl-CoA hydratase / 3-hydroxybutyryl-CoA epimerase